MVTGYADELCSLPGRGCEKTGPVAEQNPAYSASAHRPHGGGCFLFDFPYALSNIKTKGVIMNNMEELIYNAIIEHINHSVIRHSSTIIDYQKINQYAVENPATRFTIYFRQTTSFLSTTYSTYYDTNNPAGMRPLNDVISPEQSKQLFEEVEKRYETNFLIMSRETRKFYIHLLTSNNKSNGR